MRAIHVSVARVEDEIVARVQGDVAVDISELVIAAERCGRAQACQRGEHEDGGEDGLAEHGPGR